MRLALLLALACGGQGAGGAPEGQPPEGQAPADEGSSGEEAPPEGADTGLEERAARDAERAVARHILINHKESRGSQQARTRREARALAEELRERILAGEEMAELARQHSTDKTAKRGGYLGSAARGSWVPAFEDAVWSLRVGELAEVVETEYGFHVIRREALTEYHLLHVVVYHQGARFADEESEAGQRSVEEARALAEAARAELVGGAEFTEVAARYSDGPNARRGADLGWVLDGELGPAFDEAVGALEVGEISGVIQTNFGLHLVQRIE